MHLKQCMFACFFLCVRSCLHVYEYEYMRVCVCFHVFRIVVHRHLFVCSFSMFFCGCAHMCVMKSCCRNGMWHGAGGNGMQVLLRANGFDRLFRVTQECMDCSEEEIDKTLTVLSLIARSLNNCWIENACTGWYSPQTTQSLNSSLFFLSCSCLLGIAQCFVGGVVVGPFGQRVDPKCWNVCVGGCCDITGIDQKLLQSIVTDMAVVLGSALEESALPDFLELVLITVENCCRGMFCLYLCTVSPRPPPHFFWRCIFLFSSSPRH